MSVGTPVAADVPNIFDVVFAGYGGFTFARTIDASLPFHTQRATYGFTPTFLERQNVSGAFSDNQQDFFLTASQNDWSGGEQQRFLHLGDPDTRDKVWKLEYADNSVSGQVSMRRSTSSTTLVALVALAGSSTSNAYAVSSTNLYTISSSGNANAGAHGLGASPVSIVTDNVSVYMTTTSAGTVGVRKWNGAAFSTFSATACDLLAFHNNSLYGFKQSTGELFVFSTAGVATQVYQWKNADGSAQTQNATAMVSYGGKLLIAFSGSGQGSSLWQYDGVAPSILHRFPNSFLAYSLAVANGIVLVGGEDYRDVAAGQGSSRGAVYYYVNGSVGVLWRSQTWLDTSGGGGGVTWSAYAQVVPYENGAIFNDNATARLMYWDASTGSIAGVGSYTFGSTDGVIALVAAFSFVVLRVSSGTAYQQYPALSTTAATTTTVTGSLIDFDNSLTKQMRGLKVDFNSATDGNGGSVDIAYRVDDVDGSYTTLQTGAVSGTEYPITGVSGRSISVKVTLNKGTSTSGPVLKRVYARASPTLQSYKRREFTLDLSGRNGKGHVVLNNDADHPLDGYAQATNLNSAIGAAPFTITDRFGSFSGVIEPGATELIEIRPEEYIARVTVREV